MGSVPAESAWSPRFSVQHYINWGWSLTLIISARGRWKQADQKFKVVLDLIVKYKPDWDTCDPALRKKIIK